MLGLALAASLVAALASPAPPAAPLERVDVEPVWAGHPVRFAIETTGDRQYVAYYDAQRRMTIAARELGSSRWHVTRLPSVVAWDSHNYVTLAVDERNYIHVSGNMHSSPLVYFRSKQPGDISGFDSARMIGRAEDHVTYPVFVSDWKGGLMFQYRDGFSGRGRQVFNRYDTDSGTWSRVADRAFLDGGREMNAYPVGPLPGPDGWFHLVWMWRDTSLGSTNHDLSYARSRNLVDWETVAGTPLVLPITPQTRSAVVDPVPSGGGLAGIAYGPGWDAAGKVVITYCKYDENGVSQAYNARWEGDAWRLRRTTDWSYRWDLAKKGTLPEDISVRPPRLLADGRLVQEYRHLHAGAGRWLLDPATLRPAGEAPEAPQVRALREVESDFPGMEVRDFVYDRSGAYFLRWETLGFNQDLPREPPWPEPSMLRVYRSPASAR